jgi:hypothetical protein
MAHNHNFIRWYRFLVAAVGLFHPIALEALRTGEAWQIFDDPSAMIASILFIGFSGTPYWLLLLVSMAIAKPFPLVLTFSLVLAHGSWLWLIVLRSDSSTAALGVFFIPVWQCVTLALSLPASFAVQAAGQALMRIMRHARDGEPDI